ncbi:Bacteriophytochrome [Methyloligella halotolerans]|uniref:Blue-light-activated histidine kinase n=1 Tax=Methyloligella halotolerans TaxID=1177755 RepID=A0A1E2RWV5_9HYPH|nr:HWE histidine kinase domain-containing protein [Methyloligella halotolerans]ODA66693.1 Bacteriophytochrome [Methyloligella halotolerans]
MQPQQNVDLSNCDREPIHLIGSVQPFGFLLAVDRETWHITHASENVGDWLGIEAPELFGQRLNEIFTPGAVDLIRGQLQSAIMGDTVARIFAVTVTAEGLNCDVAVHLTGSTIIVECEKCVEEREVNAGASVRSMVAKLQQAGDLRNFFRVAAREMRALTKFDRVMVYRFDQDQSGEVIAEAVRPGLESYLGLHYPASDIPKQARALYERNWLRIIPDIGVAPSPILSKPGLDEPLDLSMSILRSVSPIHIEYLQNMGVSASMSVSILREGKLWGLFACHHYSGHPIPFARRTVAELFGQMFSMMVENRERDQEAAYEAHAQQLHQKLITAMATEDARFDGVLAHIDDIADLLACDGVGIKIDGRRALHGSTPDGIQFDKLVAYLTRTGVDQVYASDEIASEVPSGSAYIDRAAGMLVVPLSRPVRDYMVFFRREAVRSVQWAGDPNKPVASGPLGDRLTPRKSFNLWKETVNGHSKPWRPVELRIAEALRVSLLEVILQLSAATEHERERAKERQDLLISELNHRVRNILALIQGVISQSRGSADNIADFTKVVGGRIHALALAHDQITADNWGPASFRKLVTSEAAAYVADKADRVILTGPEVMLQPKAFTTVALVIHELVTNSAKYGALSDSHGSVHVETEFNGQGELIIRWAERGGPPVKEPTSRGFGSTLIERSIVYDLRGQAKVVYDPKGLRASFVVPADYVAESAAPVSPDVPDEEAQSDADVELPKSILIVEDSYIIALEAENLMRDLGVKSVAVACSLKDAYAKVEDREPGFVFLDVNLGEETSFALAERLLKKGVPCAFVTGYGEQIDYPPELAEVPSMLKPFTAEGLTDLLRRARTSGGAAAS